jgi:hypothetical protein
VNAEATAGGFPGWVTTGAYGSLRNNDTRYTDAWTPYFSKMSEIIAEHQVTNGGTVFIYQIENEYGDQWTNVAAKKPDPAAIQYSEFLISLLLSENAVFELPNKFLLFTNSPFVLRRRRDLTPSSGITREVC